MTIEDLENDADINGIKNESKELDKLFIFLLALFFISVLMFISYVIFKTPSRDIVLCAFMTAGFFYFYLIRIRLRRHASRIGTKRYFKKLKKQ